MSKFSELLKQSVASVNEGFERAQSDVIAVVSELEQSLKEMGPFALRFSLFSNEADGAIFRLIFDTNPQDLEAPAITILTMKIPSIGYPIFTGTYNKGAAEFRNGTALEDKAQLDGYFESMLSDPTSRFIQAVGFALRKIEGV